eukprot:3969485-Pleurochrysis_carterae.AAC.1
MCKYSSSADADADFEGAWPTSKSLGSRSRPSAHMMPAALVKERLAATSDGCCLRARRRWGKPGQKGGEESEKKGDKRPKIEERRRGWG